MARARPKARRAHKGIYKRGNVYWIRYADLSGRMVFESSGSSRFKDAEALLLSRKQAIREGKEPEAIKKIENHTFAELAEEYLKWCEPQKGFRQKESVIEQLKEKFGSLSLRHFTTRLLEQFQTERLEGGNAPATVNRLLAALKHSFTKAVQWNMVEEGALRRVRQVRQFKENKRLRFLSREEAQALVEACNGLTKAITTTALNTGMRRGEILSLKWDQVDLKHGFILLDQTKNGERREVPINQTLRRTFQGLQRRLDIPHVFYDPRTGNALTDVKKSFATALRKAGIRDLRFHDLRHTFASQLVMGGVDLTTVSRILGHKSLSMTLRYAHLAPSHLVKAVETLDRTWNDESTIQKLYNQAGE